MGLESAERQENMDERLSILLAGESWFSYSIHQKGFDSFQAATYTEGATDFLDGLRSAGHRIVYVPAHRIETEFPTDVGALRAFDVVILSDVGANTFLLTKDTFVHSRMVPNRLEAVRASVEQGGSLLMIGGYLSFAGIDGRARYGTSPIADVLPVEVLATDDRVEVPEGFLADVTEKDHPALAGVPTDWPPLLGYNRVRPKPNATVLVVRGQDPILVVGSFGAGRAAAFMSDLAPHWAPPEFIGWPGYGLLWESLLGWLAGKEVPIKEPVAATARDDG